MKTGRRKNANAKKSLGISYLFMGTMGMKGTKEKKAGFLRLSSIVSRPFHSHFGFSLGTNASRAAESLDFLSLN
jgi:hypothetical protein